MEPTDWASNYRRTVKIGLGFIGLFFATFVAWALWAPIQLGVVASGVVAVASHTKVVQHPYGGTVKEILVQDGDSVEVGQVLVRLEDTAARAQFAQVTSEYLQALVVRARLLAEKEGAEAIHYPPEVLAMQEDPAIRRVMFSQEALFRARRTQHQNETDVLVKSLEGLRQYARKLELQSQAYDREWEVLQRQISAVTDLAKEGYYPRNRLLDIQRSLENVAANRSEVEANRARVLGSIQETEARLQALRGQYLKDVEDQLAEATKRLYALQEQHAAVKDVLEKTEIRAPEAGIVMNLRIRTIGGVITAGQPILQIVPKESTFIVEAKVSPADIEDVHPAMEAVLRFVAIDPKKSPTFHGTVTYVSPDVQYDEVHKVNYYLCRIAVGPETLEKVAAMGKEVIPGMPVQVTVKKSVTTFFAYLWKPFTDRLAVAFTR